ncbi:MAG: hypothetical protein ACP6IP_04525 [Candidatus Njordarchaeia archaeon]
MKLLVSIPSKINRIELANNEMLFSTNNAIFEFVPRERRIKEIGRWTGAKIQNVSIVDNKYVVGTDKGLIIFDESQTPIWSGEKTIILPGKFSDEVVAFALTIYHEARRKYLKINKVTRDVLEGQIKKLWTVNKISFFTPYGGYMDGYLTNYLLGLSHVLDANGDGKDDLILITPGVESSFLLHIWVGEKEKVEIQQRELLNYTFRPLTSIKRDLDLDGLDEILLVSNPVDDAIVASMIKFSMGKADIQSLLHVKINDIFEGITEDGELWCSVGDVNGDKASEIFLIWEEKPGLGETKSKNFVFSRDFFGNEVIIPEPFAEYPLQQVMFHDYDGNGRDEMIILTPIGVSFYEINLDEKNVRKIESVPIMDHVYGLVSDPRDKSLLAFGPVLEDDKIWTFSILSEKQINYGPPTNRILKIFKVGDSILYLTDDRTLYVYDHVEAKALMNNVADIAKVKDKLFILKRNGEIHILDGSKLTIVHKNIKGAQGLIGLYEEKILVYGIVGKKFYVMDLDSGRKVMENGEINDANLVIPINVGGENFYIISSSTGILILDEKGKPLHIRENIFIEFGKYALVSNKKNEEDLIFLHNGELYRFDPSDDLYLANLGVKNWEAIAKVDEKGSQYYLSFQDGVYIAEKSEVAL